MNILKDVQFLDKNDIFWSGGKRRYATTIANMHMWH
jgi:hypothetical protein